MSLKTTVACGGWARRAMRVSFVLVGIISTSGCDSFVPPPPKELSTPADASLGPPPGNRIAPTPKAGEAPSSPPPARTAGTRRAAPAGTSRIVELLLARSGDSDREFLIQILRRESGRGKMAFRAVQPETGTAFSSEALAREIRAAIDRGVSGLIVESGGDPAVADALYEAVDRGIAVLVLDRPVPPRGGRTIPVVRFGAIAESGREIVRGILEVDAMFRRGGPPRIILLHDRAPLPYADEQFHALADPLKAAGKSFSVIEFDADADQAFRLLKKTIEADSKIDIVFADDDSGMRAAHQTLLEQTKANLPTFLVGGYLAYDIRTSPEVFRFANFYADRSLDTFGPRAFQALQSLLDGKPVGDRVEIPIVVHKKPILFVPKPAEAEKDAPPSKKS